MAQQRQSDASRSPESVDETLALMARGDYVAARSLATAVFLALLSIKLHSTALVYAAVLLAGVFVFSSQVLVYAYVSRHYPAHARASALGAASGVGRLGAISGPLVAGLLVAAGVAYPWGFYVFAVVALVGAVSIVGVRRRAAAPVPG